MVIKIPDVAVLAEIINKLSTSHKTLAINLGETLIATAFSD